MYILKLSNSLFFIYNKPALKKDNDILSEKYGFNDKLIRKAIVEAEIVKKGKEYIEFEILTIRVNN